MNTSSIKIMLMAILLLMCDGLLLATSSGFGTFVFLIGIAGLMLGIYGFFKKD